jgi:hypothetical protein
MSRALFLTVSVLALSLVAGCAWYEPSITQIREDLPPGSSLEHVDYYLNQHQINHSYYRKSNQVMAVIHNVQRDALVRADMSVIFTFDEYKSLKDIQINPVYTAP